MVWILKKSAQRVRHSDALIPMHVPCMLIVEQTFNMPQTTIHKGFEACCVKWLNDFAPSSLFHLTSYVRRDAHLFLHLIVKSTFNERPIHRRISVIESTLFCFLPSISLSLWDSEVCLFTMANYSFKSIIMCYLNKCFSINSVADP